MFIFIKCVHIISQINKHSKQPISEVCLSKLSSNIHHLN